MTDIFSLKGLTLRPPDKGCYATVELIGDDTDWKHVDFDENVFPIDRQNELFKYMKSPNQKFKGATCEIEFTKLSPYNLPIDGKIISIDIP